MNIDYTRIKNSTIRENNKTKGEKESSSSTDTKSELMSQDLQKNKYLTQPTTKQL